VGEFFALSVEGRMVSHLLVILRRGKKTGGKSKR
jgi:hypothetical protein